MHVKIENDPTLGLQGLSGAEASQRQAAGQGNNVELSTSRSYKQIFSENLFTFINGVFFAISVVMVLLGRWGDAFLVAVVIFGGVVVNIYQEIWAKQQLDRIALLHRPRATVLREGTLQNLDPQEIVLGDTILVQPGDRIVVDGKISGKGKIEVDEALLTGESDLIPKAAGDEVFSGSFCVSGTACYEATKVGTETFAYRLTAGAREYRRILTPLQQEINLVIRIFVLIACFLWILVGISFLSQDRSLADLVQKAAVVAGLVPAGLLLAITLAYGLGAVRMVGQDVLIQQANAVESLSNVEVLCLDKTGTLTTNEIALQEVYPLGLTEAELRSRLGDFAANTRAGNKTNEAIAALCPGNARSLAAEIPFNSTRKWSALTFSDDPAPGTYVLGAPEMLAPAIELEAETRAYLDRCTNQGLRVLLFAWSAEQPPSPELPTTLEPLGVVCLSDRLRPEAALTLEGFAKAGIQVKIISGDNPQTVAAIAQQVGLGQDLKVISGTELTALEPRQWTPIARNHQIFGRISPEQKAQLVKAMRASGQYVAMVGDGVNDVLSLKQANLAIAMESGSKAARGVADIVLLKDSFAALPHTFLEGQRIRNGIQDVMKLFMVRTFCITLLIFATAIVTDSFPLQNKQSAIVALIGVGFPTMCIPIWAKPGLVPRRSLMRSMVHFVVPATMTITLVALLVYLLYLVVAVLDLPPGEELARVNYAVPRSALVSILVMCELLLIPFLKPPTRAWVGGEPLSGDVRYTWVMLLLLGLYILILVVPPFRRFFELYPLEPEHHLFIGLVAIEWCFILRFAWRTRFLDRFLGVDLS
ncbi:HAD-IC family P-type ATPase [Oscillatoria sp. FACHB-1406]|uniref:HAD-IC family P-type ATPase n=1 Tax=Oscillatoria sp. FACHB-1406 TaxID=2692846 RepID=UPI0016827C2B|nr:HAD-IC family P-type ATPase [Oscillatoria sp. FACHB-1406]MBD2579911.1 HAD-IC family P-type ATPase [Oscillatoria sp. FACHB-1406]